jgi:predicted RNA-binding Zn-ribbon protein involved in translation (DUF1610 family)
MHLKSKTRHCIPFKTEQPRERSACPKCESVYVKRRVRAHDYVCKSCGWEGNAIKKIMW